MVSVFHEDIVFLQTGPYGERCNKRYILCLQLWCCNWLWSGRFLISSFKWITIDGCHKMHVFWEITGPWWRPSLVHHIFCFIMVRILMLRIMFFIHSWQGNFMQYIVICQNTQLVSLCQIIISSVKWITETGTGTHTHTHKPFVLHYGFILSFHAYASPCQDPCIRSWWSDMFLEITHQWLVNWHNVVNYNLLHWGRGWPMPTWFHILVLCFEDNCD